MPERLVVVFTPNNQSLDGVEEAVSRAIVYRRESSDIRPLLIYPLPSRVDASRETLMKAWRFGETERGIVGYQPRFEALLGKMYGIGRCNLGVYFDEVQVQHSPDYSFGESIAILDQDSGGRLSLSASYKIFLKYLKGEYMVLWEEGAYENYMAIINASGKSCLVRELTRILSREGVKAVDVKGAEFAHATWPDQMNKSQHAVFLLGKEENPDVQGAIVRFLKAALDSEKDRVVVPVLFDESFKRGLPRTLEQWRVDVPNDINADDLASEILKRVRQEKHAPRDSVKAKNLFERARSSLQVLRVFVWRDVYKYAVWEKGLV